MYLGRFDESLKRWVCDSMLANPHLYSLQPIYLELMIPVARTSTGLSFSPRGLGSSSSGVQESAEPGSSHPSFGKLAAISGHKGVPNCTPMVPCRPICCTRPIKEHFNLEPPRVFLTARSVHFFRAPTSTLRLHPGILAAEPITSWGPRLFCSQILNTNHNKLKEQN